MLLSLVLALGFAVPAHASNEETPLRTISMVVDSGIQADGVQSVSRISEGRIEAAGTTVDISRGFRTNYSVDSVQHQSGSEFTLVKRVDGVQIIEEINSPGEQRTTYSFHDRYLEQTVNGYVIVRAQRFEEPIAVIEPAWAIDSEGNAVESHFEVSGDILQQVTKVQKNMSLPVYADPKIRDVQGPLGKAGQDLVITSKDLGALGLGVLACQRLTAMIPHPLIKAAGLACSALNSFLTVGGSVAALGGRCLAIRFLGPADTVNLVFPVIVDC